MEEDREKLEIRKGGKFVETKWVYDEDKDEGFYQEFDRTESAIRYLFEPCELAYDVTLEDIFLLLNSELTIFNLIFGNWCEEFVKEGLTKSPIPYNLEKYDPEQIEYLELYYTPEYDKSDAQNRLNGFLMPNFHGVGVKLREDTESYKKGDRIKWGINLSPINTLIKIPVKLNKRFIIHEDNIQSKPDEKPKVLGEFENPQYTLGNILYGIIWELSFYGPPEERDKVKRGLEERMEKIDSGTAKTKSASELFDIDDRYL